MNHETLAFAAGIAMCASGVAQALDCPSPIGSCGCVDSLRNGEGNVDTTFRVVRANSLAPLVVGVSAQVSGNHQLCSRGVRDRMENYCAEPAASVDPASGSWGFTTSTVSYGELGGDSVVALNSSASGNWGAQYMGDSASLLQGNIDVSVSQTCSFAETSGNWIREFGIAGASFRAINLVSLQRTNGSVPYTDEVSVDVECAGVAIDVQFNDASDACDLSDPVGEGTVRAFWRTVVSADYGSGWGIESVKQGLIVGSLTSGTITSRQGWFAGSRVTVSDHDVDCLSEADWISLHQKATINSSANYSVPIAGEPLAVRVSQEVTFISQLVGGGRLDGCGRVGDVNETGVIRPRDYDLIVGLDGVDIDSDLVGEYDPRADMDADGDIDADDADVFLGEYCLGDFNEDGVVDILDVLDFLDAYGSDEASSDMDEDGVIDILDYLSFLDWYGTGC